MKEREHRRVLNLGGRIAIVTGASRGIGRGVAAMLAARGAHVVVAAREDHAQEAAAAIVSGGGLAEAATLDVTDVTSVNDLASGVLARHGRVDILVNNAGTNADQLLLRMKRDEWDRVLATNLTGAFSCVQAVLKSMVRQRSGRIINIGSVVGQVGNAGQANYAASKAGLIGFSRSLAREVASRNITVNVVAPGLIETEMTGDLTGGRHAQWLKQVPVGRIGTADDVAAAVCFLASDEASYITGHVLAVNGGMYM